MTALLYPTTSIGLLGAISGRANPRFRGAGEVGLKSGQGKHWAIVGDTSGVIRDRVMIRITPSSPESPFKGGRVWLFRALDGYKAWEGFSDAQGWYAARGLEVGVAYIAVAIDPYKEHRAVGAGPVVALQEAA